MALEWTHDFLRYAHAPGGYVVERRCGHWMTFVPGEDSAVYVSPHVGYGHSEVDYSDAAKLIAEKHAQQGER